MSRSDNADELEQEANHDEELADERRDNSPEYANYLYQRANWKRYLARNRRHNEEAADDM